jgi:uncharacterized membrane protein
MLVDEHRRPACSTRAVAESTPRGVSRPAEENIRAIIRLERESAREATRSERVSDRISRGAGTLAFAVAHICLFAAWAGWNALAPTALRFDPYPYGLLTFIVSLEGVLIGTFVLIAQNRMTRQSDRRDHLDLQIDLLTEQEMTLMLRMLRRISERLGIPADDPDTRRAETLTEETNVYELMRRLRRELPDEP